MKKQLYLAFLAFLAFLITACSKNTNNTPTPASPIVGTWNYSRYINSGIPASYSANGSYTATQGQDAYTFKSDNSYSETFLISSGGTATESGSWAFSDPVVNLTPKTITAGQQLSGPYSLTYLSSTSEITTGPLPQSTTAVNPVTNVKETVNYYQEYIYRKQ